MEIPSRKRLCAPAITSRSAVTPSSTRRNTRQAEMAILCSYCKIRIDGSDIPECPACAAPHHEECWHENRGCAVYGCPEAPEDEPKMAVPNPGGALAARGSAAANQPAA